MPYCYVYISEGITDEVAVWVSLLVEAEAVLQVRHESSKTIFLEPINVALSFFLLSVV